MSREPDVVALPRGPDGLGKHIVTPPQTPGMRRGPLGCRRRCHGLRAGEVGPAGPGRAGPGPPPGRTRTWEPTHYDSPLKELQNEVLHSETG